MTSNQLPSVLTFASQPSISLERALKQMQSLLETLLPESSSEQDRLNASIDDLELMLGAICRD